VPGGRLLEDVSGSPEDFGLGKGSLALKRMFRKKLMEQISSGGWSGAVSSGSSPRQEAVKEKRVLACGGRGVDRLRPDRACAAVDSAEKPIRLRKDGSFTLRFSLPDGRQEIPVSATSFDG